MDPWLSFALPYLPAALILLATFLVSFAAPWVVGWLLRSVAPRVAGTARRLTALVVWAVGLTLAVQSVGLNGAGLYLILTRLGIATLLAPGEPLENIGAKFFPDVYTPFKVGDTIEVLGFAGKVVEINALATILLTGNQRLVSVPNSALLREVV